MRKYQDVLWSNKMQEGKQTYFQKRGVLRLTRKRFQP